MQRNSTPTLQKSEPFTTENPLLNSLLKTWYAQGMVLADAEEAGLPEPEIDCPSLPPHIRDI